MKQESGLELLGEAFWERVRKIVRDEVRHEWEMREAVRTALTVPPRDESKPDELLMVEQVAEILKVAADTVRGWIRSGGLRASRPGNGKQPGRKYRVRRADLDAFVEESESRTASSVVDPAATGGDDRGPEVSLA
jgi:excisionase family DNA binding protein